MKEKKFYQKKWFIILVVVLVLLAFGSSDSTNETVEGTQSTISDAADSNTNLEEIEEEVEEEVSDTKQENSNSEETEATDTKVEEEKETTETNEEDSDSDNTAEDSYEKFTAGTYKVGVDIPAGEYVVFNDGFLGYVEISSDSSGSLDSIIANENFNYNTIITIKDGQYFKLSSAYAVSIEAVTSLDTTGEGMFKVGTFLAPGEYKIEVDEDSITGYGYVEVTKDSSHTLNSIITNDNFENSKYITVKEGQYLTLSGAHIVTP